MTLQELWKSILSELQLTVSHHHYNMFFSNTEIISASNNTMVIGCGSDWSKSEINKKYKNEIQILLQNKTGVMYNIELVLFESLKDNSKNTDSRGKLNNLPLFNNIATKQEAVNYQQQVQAPQQTHQQNFNRGLISDYTFENFVIGPNNRLAYTVAKTIAENPGGTYNPFLIYSNVGLGKTHLIQAIGNEIQKTNPNLKVLYCTGQEFVDELMEQLQTRRSRGGTISDFKKKYTGIDVWLIDDVQIIAGRDTTQEEFYFAFNSLYLNKKQIVLSSDRHPSEIAKLEDRISSRFRMGMIADIQMPDVDIRTAILRTKRDKLSLNIDNNTIDYISQNVETNVRELEGALIQVATYCSVNNLIPNENIAKEVLGNSIIRREEKNIRPTKVIQEVSKFYGIEIREIKGKTRTKNIVLPRQITMYMLKELNQLPLKTIGDILGGRDHTTIMHGTEKISKELENGNLKLKKELSTIKDKIFE